MIDFYYWPTPNGWKVSIALEEFGFDYRDTVADSILQAGLPSKSLEVLR